MKAISFYNSNIDLRVIEYQKKVFDHFGIEVEQVLTGMTHPDAIDFYLKTASWEEVALFDIDCIPLVQNILEIARMAVQNDVIYGAAQNANHLQDYIYCSPAFMCFTRSAWTGAGKPSFREVDKYDVGGYFSSLREKLLLYPTKVEAPIWRLTDTKMFGHGTIYDGLVYHAFESRCNHESTSMFIEKCKEVIGE